MVEAFSTLNGVQGVMHGLLKDSTRKLFTWCIWDVIARCDAPCAGCNLERDCKGRARNAGGFIPVADVRTMRSRVAASTWALEMLCDPVANRTGGFTCVVRHYFYGRN